MLPATAIPDGGRAVEAGGGQPLSIRTEANVERDVLVAGQGEPLASAFGRYVPRAHGAVEAATSQRAAIGAEGEVHHGAAVPGKGEAPLTGRHLPDLGCGIVATGCQQATVGTKRCSVYRPAMVGNSDDGHPLGSGNGVSIPGEVPQLHGAVPAGSGK